ncbi:MAG: phosphohistidine phosphatase [Pirellulaceae bacterium]|jgi:phosphohistidine phosphatase
MKTLLVLRHAKSSWSNPGQSDHERPLNKRGRAAAPRMGQLLVEQQIIPELIICSTAERARQTGDLLADACKFSGNLVHETQLYLAPPSAYIEQLQQMDDAIQSVMVIGHNPGLEDLVGFFCDDPNFVMPTAALAELHLEIDEWRKLGIRTHAKLNNYWIPKELDANL